MQASVNQGDRLESSGTSLNCVCVCVCVGGGGGGLCGLPNNEKNTSGFLT